MDKCLEVVLYGHLVFFEISLTETSPFSLRYFRILSRRALPKALRVFSNLFTTLILHQVAHPFHPSYEGYYRSNSEFAY